MNRQGISGKAVLIIVIVALLIIFGWIYLSGKTVSQDSGISSNADTETSGIDEAIEDTNSIDNDLGLEEDFEYGTE